MQKRLAFSFRLELFCQWPACRIAIARAAAVESASSERSAVASKSSGALFTGLIWMLRHFTKIRGRWLGGQKKVDRLCVIGSCFAISDKRRLAATLRPILCPRPIRGPPPQRFAVKIPFALGSWRITVRARRKRNNAESGPFNCPIPPSAVSIPVIKNF